VIANIVPAKRPLRPACGGIGTIYLTYAISNYQYTINNRKLRKYVLRELHRGGEPLFA